MKTYLRQIATVGALGLALTFSSCVNPYAGPNEQNGTVYGAVGGGVLGAIIGNQSGRPLEGAAIGGLLGSLAGSRIGAARDQSFFGYYGVRNNPVYYRTGFSPYRYGYTPYRYGYSPYRTGYYASNYRWGAPMYGGFGRGGYSPYCW